MAGSGIVQPWQLRARFALALAEMYGTEVPLYTTLVDVCRAVNSDVAAARGDDAARLGSLDRVTAERHGAIRVGSPRELSQVAKVFAAFGMHPVGFYDLRDASRSSVPVVSTAFRPVEAGELARNPFRVFTSMLVAEDRRFFDAETQARLDSFVAGRRLFGDELLELAERAVHEGGLESDAAGRLVDLATAAFRLTTEPIDRAWYSALERISAVAADIGGVPSTHINHLTPRVLDIDDLYARMRDRGITMIDEIQGPPAWEGPDVLLRQTSFRAMAEERVFSEADGTVTRGSLRVRFGEVEQRGIALTRAGRDLYDRLVSEVELRLDGSAAGVPRAEVARDVWREAMPRSEAELAARGLGYFRYRVTAQALTEAGDHARAEGGTVPEGTEPEGTVPDGTVGLQRLLDGGTLVAEPIVYEDFLPRSAAGIFQSNLSDEGLRDDDQEAADYDLDRLSGLIGATVHDPFDLYAAEREVSLQDCQRQLGGQLHDDTGTRRPQ